MLSPGARVDRYEIESLLGQGGMGQVYAARDPRLDRRVALKVLHPGANDDARVRLGREARVAARFEHPGAVVVYDVGEADGSPYIAMELVRGAPMRAFVGDEVPFARRVRWLVEVARVLAAAHRAGITHRDVKPDNVMIRDDGAVKVVDFGIARTYSVDVDALAATTPPGSEETLTSDGALVGTPLYLAPERLRGAPADARSDQFAFAVTAYELIAGRVPWDLSTGAHVVAEILTRDAAPLATVAPGTPVEVDAAIRRGLAKDPAERFASLDEMANALAPFTEPTTTSREMAPAGDAPATRAAPAATGARARSPGRVAAAVIALLAVGAAATAAVALRGDHHADAPVPPPAADARPVLVGVACRPATLSSANGSPALANAIGVGACARLAVELGVPWWTAPAPGDTRAPAVPASATPLDVEADVGEPKSRVTLSVLGRSRSAESTRPLLAVDLAAQALAKELAGPPMSSEETRGWGAKDAASAARMRRLWRRLQLEFFDDRELGELRADVAADPGCPWGHVALAQALGSEGTGSSAEIDAALAGADRLEDGRKLLLEGMAHLLRATHGDPREEAEAVRLIQLAYRARPDDPMLASAIGGFGCQPFLDEARGVYEHFYAEAPSDTVPLSICMLIADFAEPVRWKTHVERLRATLPERLAGLVIPLVKMGQDDDARAQIALTKELRDRAEDAAGAQQAYSLVLLDPAAARANASAKLGDPRFGVSTEAAFERVAADAMAGRIERAESELVDEIARQRAAGAGPTAFNRGRLELRMRRQLGQPLPDVERFRWLEQQAAAPEAQPFLGLEVMVDFALLRNSGPRGKRARERALAELEAWTERAGNGDPQKQRSLRGELLPLLREVHGDAAAARLWHETTRTVSSPVAFLDDALALEAAGDPDAAAAYEMVTNPYGLWDKSFEVIAARARLATIRRKQGRLDEAKRLDDIVARLWADADPGLLERVRAMK